MSKFLTGEKLGEAVYDIIWEAENILMIVSPYIKLDDYFKKLFDKHKNNPELHLILIFGKNEKEVKRSMSEIDFSYFKQFPNVSIIYVSELHGKYYGNEKKGVITSINLYDYSFMNNIEFGVFSEQSLLGHFKPSADNDAWNKCMDMAETNEVVFIKRPVYASKKIIINIRKNYVKSEILYDSTEKFYRGYKNKQSSRKRLRDFPEKIESHKNVSDRPKRAEKKEQLYGYCIRSGKKIKFNPQQPMSRESWKIWNEYANENYPENYCHKTGKPSNGKTSMKNPIL